MPTPASLKPEIKDNHDGSINVTYHPTVQGRHEVQMCYEGASIDGMYTLVFFQALPAFFLLVLAILVPMPLLLRGQLQSKSNT